MSLDWTLETNGVEKTFDAWGISLDCLFAWQNKSKATVSLRTTEQFDRAANGWAYMQKATIRRDRDLTDPTTGTVVFRGYFDDPSMEKVGDAQNIVYQLHNVWWLFELNNFRQYRMQFTGFSTTEQRILSATIVAGGDGYKIDDVLTVNTGVGTLAQFQVVGIRETNIALHTGVVTLVWPLNGGGRYTSNPNTPNQPTGGTGSLCQLGLTFQPAPLLTPVLTSELFLGEDLHQDGGFTGLWPNGNGDQIGEVIDWINGLDWASVGMVGPVCSKGVLEPHTKMPVTPYNTLFANEAILNCLRWDPDAVIVVDDAADPPTLSVRKMANWDYTITPPTFIDYNNPSMPLVELNINDEQERQIIAQSQNSKQWKGIVIYYRSLSTVDGIPFPGVVIDKFPKDISEKSPFVLSQEVELLGSSLQHTQALVSANTVSPFTQLLGGDYKGWWIAHDHALSDPNVDQTTMVTIGVPTIRDVHGNNIPTGTYKYELLDSSLPTWAGNVVRAIISQNISYIRHTDSNRTVKDVQMSSQGKLHTKTILLTNIPGGLYTATSSLATAEPVPQNVAESCFRTLAVQQWAGRVTFLNDPVRQDIKLGCRLKLHGPSTVFDNLVVQAVEMRPFYGELTVTFGPGPVIDISTWIEFARATRGRMTWQLPSGRGDGGASSHGNTIDIGAASSADDTVRGVGGYAHFSVTGSPVT